MYFLDGTVEMRWRMVVTPNMKLGCISFAKSDVRQQVDITTFISDIKK